MTAPRRERVRAALVTGIVTAAVLSPLVHGRDSFPLSTYPMFASARPQAVLDTAQLVSADGTTRPVPPARIGGGEILQAAVAVRRAAQDDAVGLCRSLARGIAGSPERGDAVRIEIARQRWDPVAALARGDGPLERRVLARCAIPVR